VTSIRWRRSAGRCGWHARRRVMPRASGQRASTGGSTTRPCSISAPSRTAARRTAIAGCGPWSTARFRAGYNRTRIRRLMRMHGLLLPPRVHRRHGRPHRGQVQQPASNQRWCSDIFLVPCWSGGLSAAFAIDCHEREVFAWTASPRPLNGGDIRALMDKALWARFGETVATAPHAIPWLSDNGPQYTATASCHARPAAPSSPQRLGRTPDLLGDRGDRRPLRRVVRGVLEHHPHRAPAPPGKPGSVSP
jgi:integrase-like protein